MNRFVIVKKTDNVPSFYDKFEDFGRNRLEWFNHLRFRGFNFSLLSASWMYHLKHATSQAAAQYEPAKSVNEKIWQIRESELFELFKERKMLPLCGQITESHPNPVGMSVERFLEKKDRDERNSKSYMNSKDREIAEKFKKRMAYLKKLKQKEKA